MLVNETGHPSRVRSFDIAVLQYHHHRDVEHQHARGYCR
jgi:hypothetical protein